MADFLRSSTPSIKQCPEKAKIQLALKIKHVIRQVKTKHAKDATS